jgi:DnaK suppressor protein
VNRSDELDHVSGALEMRAGRRVEPAVCSMEHGRPALGRRIRYGRTRQPSAATFFSGVHRHLLRGLWWLSEREEETARTQRTVYRSLRVKAPERGPLLGFGKRIGDGPSEAISRITEAGVGGTLAVTLTKVDRALAKIDEGTYGLCDFCGQPIARGRMKVAPDNALSLPCAAAARRPSYRAAPR